MFYGSQVWDPWLILAQIVAVQCLYYISLGVLLWLLLGPYVVRLSLHHFFDWRWVSFHTFSGWMVVIANVFNALAASVYLTFVVERAKKCLDFASTVYIIHLITCLIYGGFPIHFEWWVVNGIGLTVTAVLGEWLCLQRELQDIPISSLRSRRNSGQLLSVRQESLQSPRQAGQTVSASSFQLARTTNTIASSLSRASANLKPSGS